MVIWPLLRPDIFRGCRSPGRGLLLFGPPVGILSHLDLLCVPLFLNVNVCTLMSTGYRQNNDWKSNSWRGEGNILLYICKFIDKQMGMSAPCFSQYSPIFTIFFRENAKTLRFFSLNRRCFSYKPPRRLISSFGIEIQ
jgi:hypothetical protein